MSGTFFALNQKYNSLRTQITNEGGGGGGGGGSYIDFPTAQGAVTLLDTTITGDLELAKDTATNNTTILLNPPAGNQSTTVSIVDTPVFENVLNPTLGKSVIIGKGIFGGQTPEVRTSVLLGADVMNSIAVGADCIDTVAIGAGALDYKDSASKSVACGSSSLSVLETGDRNTAIGMRSGRGNYSGNNWGIVSGSNNTFLGAETGTNDDTGLLTFNNSTAVGYQATITESNQIQLGTASEYVNIPNYIKFPDGSTLSTASLPTANLYSYFYNFTTTPQSILLSELRSNYVVSFSSTGTLNLPTLGLDNTSFITVYNSSATVQFSLATDFGGRNFAGRFGSNTTTLVIRPLNSIKVCYNPATNTWDAVEKSFVNSVDIALTTDHNATNVSLCNTLIRYISATSDYFVNIGDLTFRPNNSFGFCYFENTTTRTLTLRLMQSLTIPSSSGTFTGRYGSQTNTLVLPPKTQITLWATNSVSGQFLVQQRTPETVFYEVYYSGGTITTYSSPEYFDSFLYLTGSPDTTLNLPNPSSIVNLYSQGRTMTLYNASTSIITLTTPVDLFQGKYGNSQSSIQLLGGSTYTLSCTGGNWEINGRSPLETININISIGSSVSNQTTTNISDTVIQINSCVFPFATVVIADTVLGNSKNSFFNIENNTSSTIIFSLVSNITPPFIPSTVSTFTGLYGSGATTITVPPLTTYTIYIDPNGEFKVQQRSQAMPTYEVPYSGTTITDYTNSQYFDTTLLLTGSGATTLNLPDPDTSVNLYSRGRRITTINNGTSLITLSTPSGTFGGSHGNSASTIILPDNATYTLYCNGTNWEINERSSDITFRNLSVASGTSYAGNHNYLSSNLYLSLSGTSAGSITWLNAVSQESHSTTTKIYNVGLYQITLNATITTNGTFLGKYGSGTSALIIPPNTWVELFSNGTNWLVNNRSPNFNFFLFGNGTILNWSSDSQYFDSQVEFVQPDSPLITQTIVTGNATQSGYLLNIGSASGQISQGSVVVFNSRRMVVREQATGTSGGTGIYVVDYSQTVGSLTYTAYSGTGTNSKGTYSQSNNQVGTYSTITIAGAITVGQATTLGVSNFPSGTTGDIYPTIPLFAIKATGVANQFFVSAGTKDSVSAGTEIFATSGTIIQLPQPTGYLGRTLNILNSSNNPICITTTTGNTEVFGGNYAQMTLSPAVGGSYGFGVIPTNYILRPNHTVILKSNGTLWETQEGTTYGGQKSYISSSTAVTTELGDNTKKLLPFFNLDQCTSNLSGICLNTNGTTQIISNLYRCDVSITIMAVFTWASSGNSSAVIPLRIGYINGALLSSSLGTAPEITSFAPVHCFYNTTTTAFVPVNTAGIPMSQTFIGTYTLKTGEGITIGLGKINGLNASETLTRASLFISRNANP